MSANGLEVFDKTLQTTNIWLNEISEQIGPDRQLAWKVLTVVLHKVRDRIPVELAAHLGAELPLMVRGAYYDQYRPAKQPVTWRDHDEFLGEVQKGLSEARPVGADDALRAVFKVLSRHLPPGQISKVQGALPQSIRSMWEEAAEQTTPVPGRGETGGETRPLM